MSVPESPASSSNPKEKNEKPKMPAPAKWLLRITGVAALLLFLTPAIYVLKYYTADQPGEAARAHLVSLTPITPSVPVDTIAPPMAPTLPGNAADFYVPAIQSYADRRARHETMDFPTAKEMQLFLQGGRRSECHFFMTNSKGEPQYTFHDADSGEHETPYQFPISADEHYRYLSAAMGLANAMARFAQQEQQEKPTDAKLIGQAIVRLGDGLSREKATYSHLTVALDIRRAGLQVLLPSGGEALKKYVYSQQAYQQAIRAKYALLKVRKPFNVALQQRVAMKDADPMWRREAVWSLGEFLALSHINITHPMETLTAKATLSSIAVHDSDTSVRAAASDTLGTVAQSGAVIRR